MQQRMRHEVKNGASTSSARAGFWGRSFPGTLAQRPTAMHTAAMITTLYYGDNVEVLREHIADEQGSLL